MARGVRAETGALCADPARVDALLSDESHGMRAANRDFRSMFCELIFQQDRCAQVVAAMRADTCLTYEQTKGWSAKLQATHVGLKSFSEIRQPSARTDVSAAVASHRNGRPPAAHHAAITQLGSDTGASLAFPSRTRPPPADSRSRTPCSACRPCPMRVGPPRDGCSRAGTA